MCNNPFCVSKVLSAKTFSALIDEILRLITYVQKIW